MAKGKWQMAENFFAADCRGSAQIRKKDEQAAQIRG
jgi:hypothetical protein